MTTSDLATTTTTTMAATTTTVDRSSSLDNKNKKFRFDSFATEFACKEEKVDDVPDDDSGIDSEETQVSPPLVQQPLSLVLRKEQQGAKLAGTVRHWKKFLKDQAVDRDDEEEEEEEAENLSCKRIKTEESPVTSVAHALLSLGRQQPLSEPPKAFHCMPPFAPQQHQLGMHPLRPIPLSAAAPLRPLQDNLMHCRRNPYSSHPLPWPHLMRPEQQQQQNNEPENLSIVKLPQHPTPLAKTPFQPFFQLQSPTLTSTCHTSPPNMLSASPLKEIQSNRQHQQHNLQQLGMPRLPQQPLLLPPPSSETAKFLHPAFQSENKRRHSSSSCSSTATTSSSSNSKPFSCLECKKSFSTQSGYAKHEQLHCNNQIQKSFSCKYCNKGYTSLSALKMHIRTHTLPCKCDVCGKSFSRPWLLQGHVRTHSGEKPFSCTYCARSFADKSNLRAHLQTHLQTKKYSCPGCQKTFSRMSLLNKHTDGGCQGLQNRNEECVQTLVGLSTSGLIRT